MKRKEKITYLIPANVEAGMTGAVRYEIYDRGAMAKSGTGVLPKGPVRVKVVYSDDTSEEAIVDLSKCVKEGDISGFALLGAIQSAARSGNME